MTQLLKNLVKAYFAISRLERLGCAIGSVSITDARATIRLSHMPRGVRLPSYGYASPPGGTVRVPVLCVAHWGATRVEWISKERHQ